MGDERDRWLDEDTAERLLRGEPVEVTGDGAGESVQRLSRALREAALIAYANTGVEYGPAGETRGEALAVAAFRRSGAGAAGSGATPKDDTHRRTPGTVRPGSCRRPAAPAAGSGRRRGVAAALTGCLLGGTALALGTGVLVPAFTGARTPDLLPSTAARPHPGDSGHADARGPAVPPPQPLQGGSSRVPTTTPTALGPWMALGRRIAGLTGTESTGGDTRPHTPNPLPTDARSPQLAWYAAVLATCRDYTAGALDPARRSLLLEETGKSGGADEFCAAILAGQPSSGAGDGPGGPQTPPASPPSPGQSHSPWGPHTQPSPPESPGAPSDSPDEPSGPGIPRNHHGVGPSPSDTPVVPDEPDEPAPTAPDTGTPSETTG